MQFTLRTILQFIIPVLRLGKRLTNGAKLCLALVVMRLKENDKIVQNNGIKFVHLALLTLGVKVV